MKRPMRLLLHAHSVLNVHGPLFFEELVDKLVIRGLRFYPVDLSKLLNSEAATYFMIRKDHDAGAYEVIPVKKVEYKVGVASKLNVEYPKGPVPWPKTPMVAVVMTPSPRQIAKEEKKREVLRFCELMGRWPSQLKKEEKTLYGFIQNNRKDEVFMAQLKKFKKGGRILSNEEKLGLQLADSGGTGF